MARKKFGHISLLHVVHHGLMPLSCWTGPRFLPGGHSTFFGMANVFVHFFMYLYYMMAAMGPQYAKYIWWKRHMTNLQMIQFVAIFIHGFQLFFYDDCDYPIQFGYFIGAHGVLFFILFSRFYYTEYLTPSGKAKRNTSKVGWATICSHKFLSCNYVIVSPSKKTKSFSMAVGDLRIPYLSVSID